MRVIVEARDSGAAEKYAGAVLKIRNEVLG